jgi:acetyl-CoA carboxylase carboxyl transferase subunit alpha
MRTYLDFEKPVAELEGKLAELQLLAETDNTEDAVKEVERVQAKAAAALDEIYNKLTPWQKAQVARHPERPHTSDYISHLITDFVPFSGDRSFADDAAITGGPGRFRDMPVMVIGHEKGSNTESRLKHNFGMARPEGYRKAVRLMEMADRFSLPVLSFVDTAGAYPGIGAEERGQAEAIARSTDCCLSLGVPMVALIIGEGGSGGAIAIAAGNKTIMMEHSIYSVISPEGAASILWHDAARAEDAATAMKITASDLLELGVVDDVVSEPPGGAHRDPFAAMDAAGEALAGALASLDGMDVDMLRKARREKFLAIGRNL